MKNISNWIKILNAAREIRYNRATDDEEQSRIAKTIIDEAVRGLVSDGYPVQDGVKSSRFIEIDGQNFRLYPPHQIPEENGKKQQRNFEQQNNQHNEETKPQAPIERAHSDEKTEQKVEQKENLQNDRGKQERRDNPSLTTKKESDKVSEPVKPVQNTGLIDATRPIATSVVSSEAPTKEGNTDTSLSPKATESDGTFPGSIHKNDLSFEYFILSIYDKEGQPRKSVEMITTPMSMKEGEYRTMSWFYDSAEGTKQTIVNKAPAKLSVFRSNNIGVLVSGKVENGLFRVDVKLAADTVSEGYSLKIVKHQRGEGKMGHILVSDVNVNIHIMPIGTSNREDGVANIIYAIERPGREVETGDTLDCAVAEFDMDGTLMNLIPVWAMEQEKLFVRVNEA